MIDRRHPLLPLTRRWFVGATGAALAVLSVLFVFAFLCLVAGILTVAVCVIWIIVVFVLFILLALAPLLVVLLVFGVAAKNGENPPGFGCAALVFVVLAIGLMLGTGWSGGCWQFQAENAKMTWGFAVPGWVTCLDGSWFLCKLFFDYEIYWFATGLWCAAITASGFTLGLIAAARVQGLMLRVFRKIRLQCPRCGEASTRWRCTGCAELHNDLYPTRFGIWTAACMKCGHNVPTTVFGQRKVDKVCGVCGYDLCHPDLGRLPEFHIAVVGAKNGGKSHLMTAALEFLDKHFSPANGYELAFANSAEEREYRDRVGRLSSGQVLPQTTRSSRPTAFTISIKKTNTGDGCLLYFYDAAGEDIQEGASEGKGLSGHDFHAFVDAVILVVDPFAEEGLRREIEGGGEIPQNVNPATHDAHYILGRMIPHWARTQRVSADGRFAFPIAVVLTKMDASGLASRVGGFTQLDRRYSSFAEVAEDAESLSDQVRLLLERSGSVDLLRLLESHFGDIRFFGVSSLGRIANALNRSPFQSQGAFAPLAWLLHHTTAMSTGAGSVRSARFFLGYLGRSLRGIEGSRAKWAAYATLCLLWIGFVGGFWWLGGIYVAAAIGAVVLLGVFAFRVYRTGLNA